MYILNIFILSASSSTRLVEMFRPNPEIFLYSVSKEDLMSYTRTGEVVREPRNIERAVLKGGVYSERLVEGINESALAAGVNLRIKNTKTKGLGLFATASFNVGDCVTPLGGVQVLPTRKNGKQVYTSLRDQINGIGDLVSRRARGNSHVVDVDLIHPETKKPVFFTCDADDEFLVAHRGRWVNDPSKVDAGRVSLCEFEANVKLVFAKVKRESEDVYVTMLQASRPINCDDEILWYYPGDNKRVRPWLSDARPRRPRSVTEPGPRSVTEPGPVSSDESDSDDFDAGDLTAEDRQRVDGLIAKVRAARKSIDLIEKRLSNVAIGDTAPTAVQATVIEIELDALNEYEQILINAERSLNSLKQGHVLEFTKLHEHLAGVRSMHAKSKLIPMDVGYYSDDPGRELDSERSEPSKGVFARFANKVHEERSKAVRTSQSARRYDPVGKARPRGFNSAPSRHGDARRQRLDSDNSDLSSDDSLDPRTARRARVHGDARGQNPKYDSASEGSGGERIPVVPDMDRSDDEFPGALQSHRRADNFDDDIRRELRAAELAVQGHRATPFNLESALEPRAYGVPGVPGRSVARHLPSPLVGPPLQAQARSSPDPSGIHASLRATGRYVAQQLSSPPLGSPPQPQARSSPAHPSGIHASLSAIGSQISAPELQARQPQALHGSPPELSFSESLARAHSSNPGSLAAILGGPMNGPPGLLQAISDAQRRASLAGPQDAPAQLMSAIVEAATSARAGNPGNVPRPFGAFDLNNQLANLRHGQSWRPPGIAPRPAVAPPVHKSWVDIQQNITNFQNNRVPRVVPDDPDAFKRELVARVARRRNTLENVLDDGMNVVMGGSGIDTTESLRAADRADFERQLRDCQALRLADRDALADCTSQRAAESEKFEFDRIMAAVGASRLAAEIKLLEGQMARASPVSDDPEPQLVKHLIETYPSTTRNMPALERARAADNSAGVRVHPDKPRTLSDFLSARRPGVSPQSIRGGAHARLLPRYEQDQQRRLGELTELLSRG